MLPKDWQELHQSLLLYKEVLIHKKTHQLKKLTGERIGFMVENLEAAINDIKKVHIPSTSRDATGAKELEVIRTLTLISNSGYFSWVVAMDGKQK